MRSAPTGRRPTGSPTSSASGSSHGAGRTPTAARTLPAAGVRVELTAPSGAVWRHGDDADAPNDENVVRGSALDFCLVTTQRRHVDDTDLEVTGDAARDWMLKAQAFAGPPTDGPAARITCESGGPIMKTAATEMFGIDVPIFAFSHCRDVVAAVCKAGGMGVLGAVAHSPEQLEIDLDWIEAEIGDRPYGVDLIVPAKYAGSDEGGLSWSKLGELIPPEHVAFVDDLLRKYDVPELPPTRGGRAEPRGRGGHLLGIPRRSRSSRSRSRTVRRSWSTRSARRRRT